MKLKVRLFAAARQVIGADEVEVNLPEDFATVGGLRDELTKSYPELGQLKDHLRFSVNQEYARNEDTIPTDAEVACIPPVSGG